MHHSWLIYMGHESWVMSDVYDTNSARYTTTPGRMYTRHFRNAAALLFMTGLFVLCKFVFLYMYRSLLYLYGCLLCGTCVTQPHCYSYQFSLCIYVSFYTCIGLFCIYMGLCCVALARRSRTAIHNRSLRVSTSLFHNKSTSLFHNSVSTSLFRNRFLYLHLFFIKEVFIPDLFVYLRLFFIRDSYS